VGEGSEGDLHEDTDQNALTWRRRLDVIAQSVRVRDIAEAAPRIEADWSLIDGLGEVTEAGSWFGIVWDGSQLIGYVAMDDHSEGRTCREAALPIPVDLIVEESSPVLRVATLLARSPIFFGLKENAVSSVVSWQDYDSPLGRIVVMALILEFEVALDEILEW